ncbi:MAG: LysM peptidoglycan-binding domain-containing protein, partial [Gemmatimonadaceae bacterium]
PKSERIGLFAVTSKKGESIRSIATHEGISTSQLSLYNPKLKLLKSGNLAPGQSMLVPTLAVAQAAAVVPDPSIERYGSTRGTAAHVVKHGETLGGIAKQYHTTTAQLMKANGLRRALIFPGQTLVVRKASAKAAPAKARLAKTTSTKKKGGPAGGR